MGQVAVDPDREWRVIDLLTEYRVKQNMSALAAEMGHSHDTVKYRLFRKRAEVDGAFAERLAQVLNAHRRAETDPCTAQKVADTIVPGSVPSLVYRVPDRPTPT
jgi:hypothetical protein